VRIFLSSDLHAHRRGRFLANILDVEPLLENALPDSGFVLMGGQPFQETVVKQQDCVTWARQPGCTLLLIPPYKEGRLFAFLDWTIGFNTSQLVVSESDSVAHVVAKEVVYRLDGSDGSNDSAAGHVWVDHSSNTRYWKDHSNSGTIAATTLPLWSISLMDYSGRVRGFLEWLNKQTGKSTSTKIIAAEQVKSVLTPQDHTVMVCCYGMEINTASRLSEVVDNSAIPFLNLAGFNLPQSFDRLGRYGLLDDTGLTTEGLAYLKASPYWAFAEQLKGMA
jgi:hypothetical protein